jgi:hypothetical protein
MMKAKTLETKEYYCDSCNQIYDCSIQSLSGYDEIMPCGHNFHHLKSRVILWVGLDDYNRLKTDFDVLKKLYDDESEINLHELFEVLIDVAFLDGNVDYRAGVKDAQAFIHDRFFSSPWSESLTKGKKLEGMIVKKPDEHSWMSSGCNIPEKEGRAKRNVPKDSNTESQLCADERCTTSNLEGSIPSSLALPNNPDDYVRVKGIRCGKKVDVIFEKNRKVRK